ncbi:MAG TPA: LysM peptidoglycan-binding domain-containing protein [Chthoniobacterales bacterium]|jgi:LysM repeat protein
MTRFFPVAICVATFCLTNNVARAQGGAHELSQLEILSKKIDDQNTKIDALSQQILKLQQEVGQSRGETVGVPETSPTPAPPAAAAVSTNGSGATHVVTKGETLTSIARQYKVTIADLQKLNHIENDRKLQIGQTLAIPGAPTPSPTASPNE